MTTFFTQLYSFIKAVNTVFRYKSFHIISIWKKYFYLAVVLCFCYLYQLVCFIKKAACINSKYVNRYVVSVYNVGYYLVLLSKRGRKGNRTRKMMGKVQQAFLYTFAFNIFLYLFLIHPDMIFEKLLQEKKIRSGTLQHVKP